MREYKFVKDNEKEMRIHLKISRNTEIIPFDYQQLLAGVLHKWIGKENDNHDAISLYSYSWLKNGKAEKKGIQFSNGANWFISAFDSELIKVIISGIQQDPIMFGGLKVEEITLQENPEFGNEHKFNAASPIFVKRKENERIRFYYFDEKETDAFLTETLVTKLKIAGINSEKVSVAFDKNYANASKKGTTYKGIKSIGNVCPVIIKGTPEQITFAWNVGLGNSTGIGFGALN